MTNIWELMLQTLNVSLVAALLLVVKQLLRDKLSPRWQYGAWSILLLRILIPSGVDRQIILPLPLWLETWKAVAEKQLDSCFTEPYTVLSPKHILPVPNGLPRSVTDWLLILYIAGCLFSLLRYLISYLRLRKCLMQAVKPSSEVLERLGSVADRYHLNTCPVVAVPGLATPFICGIFRPILAVPLDSIPDDKVFLHELLHLKYRDAWHTTVWCILRCLHWCNPFLQFVFRKIENDIESLCDQRVLERLEGEERREYGAILLQMASERYPRMPGTTSISNGANNISKRIEAIVRFKNYPKGMALVSVCILIVLANPTLAGSAIAYDLQTFLPGPIGELDQAMAAARIHRCSTMAGALDTYAKGLMTENGVMIAAASPLSAHQDLEDEMRKNSVEDGWVAYHLDADDALTYVKQSDGYRIYNLIPLNKSSYACILGFSASSFLNPDGIGWQQDQDGNIRSGSVLVPVQVHYDGDWVVTPSGDAVISYKHLDQQTYLEGSLSPLRRFYGEGKTGTVTVENVTVYRIDNTFQHSDSNIFSSSAAFDVTPKLDTQFKEIITWQFASYDCNGNASGQRPTRQVGMHIIPSDAGTLEFETLDLNDSSFLSSSSSDGRSSLLIGPRWDGTLANGSGSSSTEAPAALPEGYTAGIFWDDELVEVIFLEEVVQ